MTDSAHGCPVAPNHLNRAFSATRPNEKWVTDITDIPTREGWLYLALALDIFSRKVVGWAMETHREASLVEAALRMALARRCTDAGLLHRPRQAIRQPQLSGADCPLSGHCLHERTLRQRLDGELHRHPQD